MQTWLLHYPWYICYAITMSQTHQGQVFLIRKDLPHSVLDVKEWESNNIELQGIQTTLSDSIWSIVNIYVCNNSKQVKKTGVFSRTCMSWLRGRPIVCGDFNARSGHWGNPTDNAQRCALDKALMICLSWTALRWLDWPAIRESDSDKYRPDTILSGNAGCTLGGIIHYGSNHFLCSVRITKGQPLGHQKRKLVFKYECSNLTPLDRARQVAWKRKFTINGFHQPPWWTDETEKHRETKRTLTKVEVKWCKKKGGRTE